MVNNLQKKISVKVNHENHYFRYAPLYKNDINSEIFLFLADFAFRQYFHSHFGSFRISAVFAFRQFSYLSSCRISAVSKGKNKKLLKYENCRNANKSETAEMRKLLKCDDILKPGFIGVEKRKIVLFIWCLVECRAEYTQ